LHFVTVTPTFRAFRVALGTLGLGLVVGCSNPTGPGEPAPPATGAPTITCPAAVVLTTATAPVAVSYDAPKASGGTAPLTTACSIPSGAPFPTGTTDVVCSTTDAEQRRAQCVLKVTVSVAPRLLGVRFLAFGDSITEGEVSAPATAVKALEPHHSYPTVLTTLLRDRYAPQAGDVVVFNRGIGGETVGAGEDRLVQEINSLKPDVLLLLEGANDVNANALAPAVIATTLRADIIRAHRNGVKKVFISTLLPQVPGRHRAWQPERVEPVNEEIRYVANAEGAVLVDAHAAFDAQKELLIGEDGLHPTADGYRRLAELFLAAIAANFEAPAGGTSSLSLFTPPGRR
jgi:lysophospholipase L1-like esterase